jgi:dUTPase
MLLPRSGLLSGDEIKDEGLIVEASDDKFKASTYDLTVGEILPGGKRPLSLEPTGEFRLAPGGTVRVIARESLRLPDGITGHALPRNTLCTQGVLAINIGIVDPGFHGPISSTLLNFGASDFMVRPGEAFLRVSFHRCPKSAKSATAEHWNREEYIERAKLQVAAYSARTFLNIEETVSRAAEGAFGKYRNAFMIWLAVAAVALAAVTILVPVGASYADRFLTDRHRWEAETEKAAHQKMDDQYAAEIKRLHEELAQLRSDLLQRKSVSPNGVKK